MKTQNANIIWHLVWFRNATAVLGFPLLLSLSLSPIYISMCISLSDEYRYREESVACK